jgi:Helix-turn-helix domain
MAREASVELSRPFPKVGEPFNPYGIFNGIFIPEMLVKARGISPGAKLTYGRLARFAGQNGNCYPAVTTLALEIAVSVRQLQRYLGELEAHGFIRRQPRVLKAGQTSSTYVFLWHTLFELGVTQTAPEGVTNWSPKESQMEESQSKETGIADGLRRACDLDSPPTNRKNRDSRLDLRRAGSGCKQYHRLREALADYMTDTDDERVYPRDRLVVDVMYASGGATEEDVVECLRYLKEERGLRPGTKYGPRGFSWFKTVVAGHFLEKREREEVNPRANTAWTQGNGLHLSEAVLNSMTETIEIPALLTQRQPREVAVSGRTPRPKSVSNRVMQMKG